MHANKGLPCVPVGENFTVRGIEFKRTATKQAQCMRCNQRFMPKGYGQHIAKLPSTRCTAPASRDKRERWTRHERRQSLVQKIQKCDLQAGLDSALRWLKRWRARK